MGKNVTAKIAKDKAWSADIEKEVRAMLDEFKKTNTYTDEKSAAAPPDDKKPRRRRSRKLRSPRRPRSRRRSPRRRRLNECPQSASSGGASGSIKNIQQVTRAMQLVAASKMRRAQAAVLARGPTRSGCGRVAGRAARQCADRRDQPAPGKREVKRVGIVLVTTDRGLVGPMNAT